ncbi:MAG: sulfite exporter TauE/SafE family protein [Pseudomonadota bacterium]
MQFTPVVMWPEAITFTALFVSFGVAVLAGLIKGIVGFALPLVLVSGLSSFLDPKLALAGILFPIVVSNGLQTFRKGVAPALTAARQYWRYLLMVCIFIFLAAQVVAQLPTRVFYLVLGVPVVAISLVQLAGLRLTIPPERQRSAEWIAGIISGILGGLAGTWGPVTVLYLLAVGAPMERQMIVQGVIYGLGSITLFVAHLNSGILNMETAPFSALLVVPGVLGMAIGFRIQDRLDQEKFRTVTLVVLTVAGLNLIRKGILG